MLGRSELLVVNPDENIDDEITDGDKNIFELENCLGLFKAFWFCDD